MNATDSDVIELEIRALALKEASTVDCRMIWDASIFGAFLKRL